MIVTELVIKNTKHRVQEPCHVWNSGYSVASVLVGSFISLDETKKWKTARGDTPAHFTGSAPCRPGMLRPEVAAGEFGLRL
jgi:hypothetical protein